MDHAIFPNNGLTDLAVLDWSDSDRYLPPPEFATLWSILEEWEIWASCFKHMQSNCDTWEQIRVLVSDMNRSKTLQRCALTIQRIHKHCIIYAKRDEENAAWNILCACCFILKQIRVHIHVNLPACFPIGPVSYYSSTQPSMLIYQHGLL